MWPFKKKTYVIENIKTSFTTVICIPGNWNNWDEFILSVVTANNGEYIAAGKILMNNKSDKFFTLDFCEKDPRMQESFSFAGSVTRMTQNCIDEVGSHKSVLYISAETGNLGDAEQIALATNAILKAGGIAVKIETTGKAFEKTKWLNFFDNFEIANLYEMFVLDSISDSNGNVYSCGMQNLGYKDTIVSGEEFQSAVNLISIFGYYQIVDKPTIANNQTFSIAAEAPIYKISNELIQPNKGDEFFENPFGMWRLTKQ
jgi:hypothetical protein